MGELAMRRHLKAERKPRTRYPPTRIVCPGNGGKAEGHKYVYRCPDGRHRQESIS